MEGSEYRKEKRWGGRKQNVLYLYEHFSFQLRRIKVGEQFKHMPHIRTEIIAVNPVHPEPTAVERAAKLLRDGEVVVFPTETVYCPGAAAFLTAALEGIFAAKGRPFNDPLMVDI